MASSVHADSQAGFAKGTELYNQVRSGYKPEALSLLRKAITSPTPINIVEIGAGTGLFTRALLEHPEWAGAVQSLRAVEPSAGMRETLTKHTPDPRVVVSDGTFDNTGLESGWADLVVIATAFHWCQLEDHEAAAAEFVRVLKPATGVLCLIWTGQDSTAAAWLTQVVERAEAYEDAGTSPNFRSGRWRQFFSTPAYTGLGGFMPPEEQVLRWTVPTTAENVANRARTASRIAPLPDPEKASFLNDLKAIIERGEGKVWVEKEKGTFELPQMSTIVIAKRRKSA